MKKNRKIRKVIKSKQIPEISSGNGVKIKIISGEVNGAMGPVRETHR